MTNRLNKYWETLLTKYYQDELALDHQDADVLVGESDLEPIDTTHCIVTTDNMTGVYSRRADLKTLVYVGDE